MNPVLPGGTIGLVGGGQLGMMFTMAARTMGYEVCVLTQAADDPATKYASQVITAKYDDQSAYSALAEKSEVITYEFEGISSENLSKLNKLTPVFPSPDLLHIVQHRYREKEFLTKNNFPVAKFYYFNSRVDLAKAASSIMLPAVLKTTTEGYDGKGQIKLCKTEEILLAWDKLKCQECVIEEWLELEGELSVIVGRDIFGGVALYGPFENQHTNHILDITLYPSNFPDSIKTEALELAKRFCETISLVGLVCLEFFLTKDGKVLVNEIAPRPHNSGHLTIEAFNVSQFEQQVRTVCGLPVSDVKTLCPAAMVNLLGDIWTNGTPKWSEALKEPNLHLHLYGKSQARPGRKMGHMTVLADTTLDASSMALAARERLFLE